MYPLAETVLFVFGLVALGYVAAAAGYLREQAGDVLTEFAVGVALPLLLFRTMVGADFRGAAPWALWATYFSAAALTWTAGHLAVTKLFGRDNQAGVVGGVSAAFSNLLLIGVPMTLGVFGQAGFEVLSLIISVHLPTMMIASVVLFGIFGRASEQSAAQMLRGLLVALFTNPLVVGILAGLAWRLTGLPLPSLASRLVDALANVAAPVALFAMGLGLRRFGISGNVWPALVLTALKLGLMPALTLLIAWALGLPPLAGQVAVAAAALPAGVNSYLIATRFGTGQALSSNQMTISTALAAPTTAFWLLVAHAVLA